MADGEGYKVIHPTPTPLLPPLPPPPQPTIPLPKHPQILTSHTHQLLPPQPHSPPLPPPPQPTIPLPKHPQIPTSHTHQLPPHNRTLPTTIVLPNYLTLTTVLLSNHPHHHTTLTPKPHYLYLHTPTTLFSHYAPPRHPPTCPGTKLRIFPELSRTGIWGFDSFAVIDLTLSFHPLLRPKVSVLDGFSLRIVSPPLSLSSTSRISRGYHGAPHSLQIWIPPLLSLTAISAHFSCTD